MNQMSLIACWIYEVTQDKKYLDDALLVWNGDNNNPGVEKQLYKGNGVWKGETGPAAFGNELPFNGASYLSIGAALYNATGDEKYKRIVIDTAKYLLDPKRNFFSKLTSFSKKVSTLPSLILISFCNNNLTFSF